LSFVIGSGTGNGEQGMENRKWRTGNGEQGTGKLGEMRAGFE